MFIRRKDVFIILILSLVTCGIYCLFWIYDTSCQLSKQLGDPSINPDLDLLLSLFCFPYTVYWFYKTAKAVNQAEINSGITVNDNAILVSLLTFAGFGIISQMIIQNQLNMIADHDQSYY